MAALLAGGASLDAFRKQLRGFPNYPRWKQEYNSAIKETLIGLKALKRKNEKLKKLVRDMSSLTPLLEAKGPGKGDIRHYNHIPSLTPP